MPQAVWRMLGWNAAFYRLIAAGQICSWYAGMIVPASDVDDHDSWELNDNVMSLVVGIAFMFILPFHRSL
jgi:hypothetical protein